MYWASIWLKYKCKGLNTCAYLGKIPTKSRFFLRTLYSSTPFLVMHISDVIEWSTDNDQEYICHGEVIYCPTPLTDHHFHSPDSTHHSSLFSGFLLFDNSFSGHSYIWLASIRNIITIKFTTFWVSWERKVFRLICRYADMQISWQWVFGRYQAPYMIYQENDWDLQKFRYHDKS